jgi:hypothetical protein
VILCSTPHTLSCSPWRAPVTSPLTAGSQRGAFSLEAAPDQHVLEGSAAQTPVWVFGELCCTTGWADPCCAALCCAVLCALLWANQSTAEAGCVASVMAGVCMCLCVF